MNIEKISNKTFDAERSLYNISDTEVSQCTFKGPQDGESVLKETRDCVVNNCDFSLRYPLWHAKNFQLNFSSMDELTRAPMWYCDKGLIDSSKIMGIKALRECCNIDITNSYISSNEFGWRCNNVNIKNTEINSEYFLFESKNINITKLNMKGKYSFQYIDNMQISNSYLDTKDAFWHSKNVIVKDSVVKGEYLGWFSDGLTLVNCQISGTQPLCYCKNLKIINCEMIGCDLAFEYSECDCHIKGHVDSIKNPKSGIITCDSIGEIIHEHPVIECNGEVKINEK